MPLVSAAILKQATDLIVRELDPKRIILFGSQARGNTNADSDVDFLVVDSKSFGPGRSRRKEFAKLAKALMPLPISKDILLYSDDEVNFWKNAPNHIIARALKEGKVLYERDD